MYVWSKRIVISLLVLFGILEVVFWVTSSGGEASLLATRTTHWMALNYFLLLVWVFVWMFDQARVRGKNIWVWMVPFFVAPLPTLMAFVLVLQRRAK
ncbi:hypothetical protein [Candidatus Nitronereus thalassa]|uniref:DUF2834 domain-containing protein n=1 Tax=Candidatus Nitronereus thalassa TaxID=3020898 RepID=A0ABU3KB76_9BACT|nr:hypothetical protein [Candidatus Nitronereus thalassa]MDT7043437.1 hypothetical protein [Candidatus Nitronereus thalassa]